MRMTRYTLLVFVMVLAAMTVIVGADGTDDPTPTPESDATVIDPDVQNPDGTCRFTWFFTTPQPETCPTGNVVTSEAAFQRFEYGTMLWTDADGNILVMFDSEGDVRWVESPDAYVPGTPERDNAWPESQPAQTVQPRFGFGVLWRTDDALRRRVGWASQNWEFVYDAGKQVAVDGTIYVSDPNGSIYELLPEGEDWRLYR